MYRNEIEDIKRTYDRKIEELNLEMKRNKNFRDKEYNDRKQKLESDRQKREIRSAEREYEFLKSREDKYRKYYHESNRYEDRDFWFNKTKEVDEAKSKLMKLKNQN